MTAFRVIAHADARMMRRRFNVGHNKCLLSIHLGLPLVHFSAQPAPFLLLKSPNISHRKC